jgi:N-acetylmuramoyl-L-alanine amidase
MPNPQLIKQMAEWVTARGVQVVFELGWRTRGVNDAGTVPSADGTWQPVGVLMHHTANRASHDSPAPGLGVLNDGRRNADGSFLHGPLCHSSGDFDGTIRIHSACRVNHAGNARASGPIPAGSANTLYLGHEINYAGTSPMSPQQRHSAVLWAAAFCAVTGRGPDVVRAHAETTVTGKWDPGFAKNKTIDMNEFRADIAAALRGDDMSAQDVWNFAIKDENGDRWPAYAYIGNTRRIVGEIESRLRNLESSLPDTIRAAIHEALAEIETVGRRTTG